MQILTKSVRVALAIITGVMSLGGCASPESVIRSEGPSMKALLENGGSHTAPTEQRSRRVFVARERAQPSLEAYTRDATNEIHQLFPQHPNPTIAIYVYPHLSTRHNAPVPGYTTAIELYEANQYALPGELAGMR